MPVNTVIMKAAAPCNLNCSYCYEYNRGNDAWQLKPKLTTTEIATQIGRRISEYCLATKTNKFQVSLHGGEPLLLGPRKLRDVFDALVLNTPQIRLHLGIQTNAVLVTDEILDVLEDYGAAVGVSIDGDIEHNRWRVDHSGKQAHDKIVRGLELVRKRKRMFAGLLAVVDLSSEPEAVLDALGKFEPPSIDLLPPFGNYDNPPFGAPGKYSLGEWMTRAFDYWIASPNLQRIRMRYLEDALVAVASGESRSDWFGVRPPGYFVVATDGDYEGLDSLKVAGDDNGRKTGLTIWNASLLDLLNHEVMKVRSKGIEGLCDECQTCPIVSWCGGGYLPTRYGRGNGYNNPSYYCLDMKRFFPHLGRWLAGRREIEPATILEINRRIYMLETPRTNPSALGQI